VATARGAPFPSRGQIEGQAPSGSRPVSY